VRYYCEFVPDSLVLGILVRLLINFVDWFNSIIWSSSFFVGLYPSPPHTALFFPLEPPPLPNTLPLETSASSAHLYPPLCFKLSPSYRRGTTPSYSLPPYFESPFSRSDRPCAESDCFFLGIPACCFAAVAFLFLTSHSSPRLRCTGRPRPREASCPFAPYLAPAFSEDLVSAT